ncbi:membrane protein insertion efficiency factor YidD [Pseudonocardia acaciae]|uniref:membrane protein insertion efficiency factor YidD n=1 Tax=Pseudonocardia acaciae TaxID=551276 RepID=UPI000A013EDB|nr:membrane protein insertion efficiency factor YidD [Pseudonocardia acaciae]
MSETATPWQAGAPDEPPHTPLLARPLVALIRFYRRWISPSRPPTCRFYPSCSEYALESLRTHGLFEGSALALWRLLRCAPWHPGGVDPVPPRRPRAARRTDRSTTEEREPC